jgi:cytochrome c553
MKKYIVVLVSLVGFGFYNFVFASSEVQEHAPVAAVGVVAFGDVEAGKDKAAACFACHGRNGNSAVSLYPKLAGQSAKYTYKQLQDFKSGARKDPIMGAQAAGISDQDMKNIAAFFAEQEVSLGMAKKELVEIGQKIYRAGNAKTGLPACIACHGPAGKGMPSAGFPVLSGQHAEYTQVQLTAFRAAGRGDHGNVKRRENDGAEGSVTMMQDTAAKMSDDEIEAVSSYISGLR